MSTLVPPELLKQVKPYLTLATQLDQKGEKAVAYYCRFYALQHAMNINKTDKECKKFLGQLMDIIEKTKSQNKSDESIASELVGQAKVEELALRLFEKADEDDRNSNFHKNLVKSFYSAGLLFDVLSFFGELSEDLVAKKQYAKHKAMYLNKCFQAGETPIPGPLVSNEEGESNEHEAGASNWNPTNEATNKYDTSPSYPPNPSNFSPTNPSTSESQSRFRVNTPDKPNAPQYEETSSPSASGGNVSIPPAAMQKAQKYCKYAASALNYDDVATAITNLEECLRILKTGK